MASAHHSRVGARKRTKLKKWSGKVTRESRALSPKNGVVKKLKSTLETAKDELRKLFA